MRFEDLEVWKRSARLSADIYKALGDLSDYGFKDQITRCSLSIMLAGLIKTKKGL